MSADDPTRDAAECDCYLHEQQVCDACQVIDSANPPKDRDAACGAMRTTAELIAEFRQLAGCPQLAESKGETCCAVCLDELGWLALDLIPRLLTAEEAGEEDD